MVYLRRNCTASLASSMNHKPILSIVSPTRGNFSDYWLEQLLRIEGNVEFVLAYPPGVVPRPIDDVRVKAVVSPYKGEVIQRFTGLLNASGDYVLALDDDDFVHPQVLALITEYFKTFPESWVLRLMMEKIDHANEARIRQDWEAIPDIHQLKIAPKRPKEDRKTVLQELPIAPLNRNFDARYLVWPFLERKDMHGAHIENFNNKVWKNELVQQALADLSQTMKVKGALTWIPFWSLDRLLGLFIQAKFFQPDIVVGHWMPQPEQIRYIVMPQNFKQEFRLIWPADALLAKSFPKYGYFWNLFFDQFWIAVKKIGRSAVGK